MKRIAITLLALAALSTAAVAADAVSPAGAPWKDMASCMNEAKGKVTSVVEAKIGGQPGVRVVAAPKVGKKPLKAGIQGAKVSDFPKGSDFCKIDFGADE